MILRFATATLIAALVLALVPSAAAVTDKGYLGTCATSNDAPGVATSDTLLLVCAGAWTEGCVSAGYWQEDILNPGSGHWVSVGC